MSSNGDNPLMRLQNADLLEMISEFMKRGRKPLPEGIGKRRIFIRVRLPEQEAWLDMITKAGFKDPSEFFQQAAYIFLASKPAGQRFIRKCRAAGIQDKGLDFSVSGE